MDEYKIYFVENDNPYRIIDILKQIPDQKIKWNGRKFMLSDHQKQLLILNGVKLVLYPFPLDF